MSGSQQKRPKLLCLIDIEGWAYDNIYRNIAPCLSQRFEMAKIYLHGYRDLGALLAEIVDVHKPDIVHVFWRPVLIDLLDPVVVKRCAGLTGRRQPEVIEALAGIIFTTSIYDHLGQDAVRAAQLAPFLRLVEGYTTCSPRLHEIYTRLHPDAPPSATIADGVDTTFFAPDNLDRLSEKDRPFRIGWVGNSQWGLLEGAPDMKGLNKIFLPAVARLQAEGVDVIPEVIDRARQWLPREVVARRYNTLDAYVCVSIHEGTPNPVLEAMASGVPIISTDVGIVRQVFGERQREFIIERSPESLVAALKRLLLSDGRRAELSCENLKSICGHVWSIRQGQWLQFFTAVYGDGPASGGQRRRCLLEEIMQLPNRTLKQRARSWLRRVPAMYGPIATVYHYTLTARYLVRERLSSILDRAGDRRRDRG